MAQAKAADKKSRHRSPAYPAVGLREAVERAKKFYSVDRKAGAPPEIAVKHMGFATAHGQAMSVLAALKKFGLVSDVNGRVVPTQRAIEIIELPPADSRRIKALQEAALAPSIYAELIQQHQQSGWPGDDVLQAELITYRNFNPNSVAGFVSDLKDTLDYAGLSDLNVLESELGGPETTAESSYSPKVGDYVQWEPQGILQFETPKRIKQVSEDGRYAFVDGSNTGLPVKELTPAHQPTQEGRPFQHDDVLQGKTVLQKANMRQDVFSLAEGNVTLQWPTPLSPDSIQDLKDWLEILKRKITRSAATAGASSEPE